MNIIHYFLILTALVIGPISKQTYAQTDEFSYKTVQSVELIIQGIENPKALSPAQEEVLQAIENALPEVLNDPLFKGHLSPFFILVDFSWKKSSGYFSPKVTRNRRPGFLIAPQKIETLQGIKGVLAHETAHLFFHSTHPSASPWISEGFAKLIQRFFNGGAYNTSIEAAFLNTTVTLTGAFDPTEESYQRYSHQSAQYGNVELYFSYLYRLCGEEQFLDSFLRTSDSKNPVDEYLRKGNCAHVGKNFNESFRSFVIAKTKQDITHLDSYLVKGTYAVSLSSQHPSSKLDEPYSFMAYLPSNGRCGQGDFQVLSGIYLKSVCIKMRYE